MKTQRHIIWSNDVCQEYAWLEKQPEDVRDMLDLGEDEEITEEMLWNLAYEQVDTNLECECENLAGCKTDGAIVAIGTVQRWNGARSAFAEIDGDTVADILRFAAQQASNNTVTVFVEDGDIKLEMLGHDNPTNPTRVTFRALRRSISEEGKQRLLDAFYFGDGNRWTLAQVCTKRLGHLPAAVYGWQQERKAA